jgi:hypothetical protein
VQWNLKTAKEIRRVLEIVCGRLERPTPESLDVAAGELSAAIRSLRELERRLKSAGPEAPCFPSLGEEMSAIGCEVSRAQALLSGAGRFLQAWARMLAAETGEVEEAVANYNRGGVPGPVLAAAGGKVVLHG